jgi:LmbE family N-acetylglucosaminyl deacetylase
MGGLAPVNVLVIAPHPDDESIGCGGTICAHSDRGDSVSVAFLTSGEAGLQALPEDAARQVRERESAHAAAILGISSLNFLRRPDGHLEECAEESANRLRPVIEREQPDLIYVTHEADWHPDHRACLPIVRAALGNRSCSMPRVLCYEILTPLREYDRVEDITPMMPRKLRAVRAHRSQVRQLRYDRGARALNEYRGAVTRMGRYVEVFAVAHPPMAPAWRERRANPEWHRVYRAAEQIAALVPPQDTFVLVDEDMLDAPRLLAPRRCIPFTEHGGRYWGKPADDDAAIGELDRLRSAGANFIIFTWPALWWLDHYAAFASYLGSQFHCVRQNEFLVAFDLRRANSTSPHLTSQEKVCGS